MQHLDGNAIAGQLADLFTFDATTASARCLGCGHVAMLATAMVYMDAMGTVVRCASCGDVLATIVEGDDRTWISLLGVSALEIPR
jgi:ribosomal protein S27E